MYKLRYHLSRDRRHNNVEFKRSCLNFDMFEVKDILFEVKKILKKNISQVRLNVIYKNNIRKYWYIYKKQVNYTYYILPSAYISHSKFHIALYKANWNFFTLLSFIIIKSSRYFVLETSNIFLYTRFVSSDSYFVKRGICEIGEDTFKTN